MFLPKNKIILSVLALLLGLMTAPIDVSAQDPPGVLLAGSVSDAASQEAVSGAEVSVQSLDTDETDQTTTGEEGHFSFKNLKPGMYNVIVQADEYQDWQREVEVTEKGTTLDVMLKPTEDTLLLSYLVE